MLVAGRDMLEGDLRPLFDDMDSCCCQRQRRRPRTRPRSNANGINIIPTSCLSQPEPQVLKTVLDRYRPDAILDTHDRRYLKDRPSPARAI